MEESIYEDNDKVENNDPLYDVLTCAFEDMPEYMQKLLKRKYLKTGCSSLSERNKNLYDGNEQSEKGD